MKLILDKYITVDLFTFAYNFLNKRILESVFEHQIFDET